MAMAGCGLSSQSTVRGAESSNGPLDSTVAISTVGTAPPACDFPPNEVKDYLLERLHSFTIVMAPADCVLEVLAVDVPDDVKAWLASRPFLYVLCLKTSSPGRSGIAPEGIGASTV